MAGVPKFTELHEIIYLEAATTVMMKLILVALAIAAANAATFRMSHHRIFQQVSRHVFGGRDV